MSWSWRSLKTQLKRITSEWPNYLVSGRGSGKFPRYLPLVAYISSRLLSERKYFASSAYGGVSVAHRYSFSCYQQDNLKPIRRHFSGFSGSVFFIPVLHFIGITRACATILGVNMTVKKEQPQNKKGKRQKRKLFNHVSIPLFSKLLIESSTSGRTGEVGVWRLLCVYFQFPIHLHWKLKMSLIVSIRFGSCPDLSGRLLWRYHGWIMFYNWIFS